MPTLHGCSPPPPATHPLFASDTTRRSLAPPSYAALALAGLVTLAGWGMSAWIGFAGALGVDPPFVVEGEARTAVFLAGIVVPPLLFIVLHLLVLAPHRQARERRWLASLPFPFAHEGYLHAMAREESKAELELVLHFAAPIQPETVAAVAESHGIDSTPRPRGPSTLRLASPSFAARREGTTRMGSTSWYTNATLHRWFRARAAPMLVELHRAHGLTGVELEL